MSRLRASSVAVTFIDRALTLSSRKQWLLPFPGSTILLGTSRQLTTVQRVVFGGLWQGISTSLSGPTRDSSSRSSEDGGSRNRRRNKTSASAALGATVVGAGILGSGIYWVNQDSKPNDQVQSEVQSEVQSSDQILSLAGSRRDDLPNYTFDEIGEHTSPEQRIWVSYKDGVYDITDFIAKHPGGDEKIRMAIGSSVEPFWELYSVHISPHVLKILETFRIGNVDPNEEKHEEEKIDYYSHEPKRHPALKVNVPKPFNAETPVQFIVDNFYTPIELFFVRNHLPVPKWEATDRPDVLEISGVTIKDPLPFSIDVLKKRFEIHSVATTIMCAGNRRADMDKSKPVKGIMWSAGAASTAKWTGVKLADVLAASGVDQTKVKHVIFQGSDQDMDGSTYEASIPAATAFDPNRDVLIAFEMNGKPIPLDHGYPLRLIVPGTIGARQVKWLKRIILSETESQSFWQQKDYKTYSPSKDLDTADPSKSLAINEFPVQAAICFPLEGATVSGKETTVKGYALSGGGRGIIRVVVSIDGGKTWTEATLTSADQPVHHQWAWTLWEATIPLPPDVDSVEILCSATDIAHNSQPETDAGIWNIRGLLENKWHRVKVNVNQTAT